MRKPPGVPQHLWNDPLFRAKYAEAHGHHFTNPADWHQGTSSAGHPRPDDRAMGPRSTGVPVTTTKTRAQTLHGLTTKQVQKLLHSRGYDIGVDGKMGPQTQAVMDAYVHGKPPSQYNSWAHRHFAPPKAPVGASVVGHVVGKVGKAAKDSGGRSLSGSGGDPLDPNVGSFLPESLAAQMASGEFDGQIKDVKDLIDQMPGNRAQHMADIKNWYGQVLDEQGKASARDSEIGKAGTSSVTNAVKSIIASLGGGANQGSGVVGAAGAADVGMLGAEGAAQDEYSSDLRPLLQSEAAGQNASEANRLDQMDRDLHNQLGDLKGKKGAALAEALLNIRDKNNQLAEQQFQNQFGIYQTKSANAIALGKALASATKPAKGSFAGSSSTQKLGVMQTAVGAIVDPDTGKLRVDIPSAVELVNSIIGGAGWSRTNPSVLQFRNQILQSVGITPQAGWS